MIFYYKCFNKIIEVKLYNTPTDMLLFWLKRFCPNVVELKKEEVEIVDMKITVIQSKKYNYSIKGNDITLYGKLLENESYLAKFITQCFQKLLIKEDILIIPASCVSNGKEGLLIIGDFWQGKTSSAISISSSFNYDLVSDNYVAIKDGNIIGVTSFISIRKEDIKSKTNSIFNINDRYFYNNKFCCNSSLKITGFLLPYINNGDNNIHFITDEEAHWYLYQKFIRLLCGETILFDGKLPSPIFLNKSSSKKILNIVDKLLINNSIRYVSASIDIIKEEGNKILCKGDEDNL